jgi:aminoglycoside phosphotransferase (APT) family kinase protein
VSAEIAARLHRYYGQKHPGAVIEHCAAISDGWETEVYAFDLIDEDRREPLILRLYPGADASEKSTREFAALRQLSTLGYPVPEALHHGADTGPFGMAYMIMRRINGHPLGQIMQASAEAARAGCDRLARLAVDLHRLDYRPLIPLQRVPPDFDDPRWFLQTKLTEARTIILGLARLDDFAPALDWLDQRADQVQPAPPCVMHGDLHILNVLMTADMQPFVIDWPNVEIGDYRYDLAWTLLLSSTFQHADRREQILNTYEIHAGHSVPDLEYFEVIAAVRRLFNIAHALTAGGQSAGMRSDTAELMRGQRGHIAAVYDWFQARSGLKIPMIETVLDSLVSSV